MIYPGFSGIEIGNPIYEWIKAAHWDNMSYEEFEEKPVSYREMIIAAYRTENKVNSVLAKEANKR